MSRPLGIAPLHIDIVGEITPDMADVAVRALAQYPQHSVALRVDTGGGSWDASYAIFAALNHHARHVAAYIVRLQRRSLDCLRSRSSHDRT